MEQFLEVQTTVTIHVSATPEHAKSLRDILKYSLFDTKEGLLSEFSVFEWLFGSSSGTRIIIWNLHRTSAGELELDFEMDNYDFQMNIDVCESSSEANELQPESRMLVPESEYSLRAYCSILYLIPKLQIILQGRQVETQFVKRTLALALTDKYKPDCTPPLKKAVPAVPVTFGYNTKNKRHFGLMMYYKNRLIKAYERVPCQLKDKIIGAGIIGVMECNYLTPTDNKQDFENTDIYRKTMLNVGRKLEEYWKKVHRKYKTITNCNKPPERIEMPSYQNWVNCETCLKWRKLPDCIDSKQLPDKWFCYMNHDPKFRNCEAEEEPEYSDDEQMKYQKTYKQNNKRAQKQSPKTPDKQKTKENISDSSSKFTTPAEGFSSSTNQITHTSSEDYQNRKVLLQQAIETIKQLQDKVSVRGISSKKGVGTML